MGRGSSTATAASAAPARTSNRRVDPAVAEVISVLKGDVVDRERKSELTRQGLMLRISSRNRYGMTSRTIPSTLGKIMIAKGRLPTPTEIKRTKKQLDTDLKKLGVKGDVTGSGYFYPSLADGKAARLQRLIEERRLIPNFESAAARGSFQELKITNNQGRAARDQLLTLLDEKAQASAWSKDYSEQAQQLRSGRITVADASEIVSRLRGSGYRADEKELDTVDAIAIGLGLPSSKDEFISRVERENAGLASLLDRVHAGEHVYGDEIEWSARGVRDNRVKRAAFGYCASADRIQADYYQQAIFELDDGTFAQVTVKRAYHDLENYVDEVVEQGKWNQNTLENLDKRRLRAEKLLRRWARAA